MGSKQRRYLISQDSTGELAYNTEVLPNSEDIAVDVTTVNTTVGNDLQDVLNKLNRPSVSQLPGYTGNDLTSITLYSSSTQTPANRIASVAITYNSSGEPTSEVWTLYSDTDGTTVLKTYTITNTWVSGTLINTTTSTT